MCRALIALIAVFLAGCNIRTNNATNTPFPTPDIPRVQFLFPVNNATVLEGTDLTIELLAEDGGDGIARVELLIDDLPHQTGTPEVSPVVPTFTVRMNWLAEGVGFHSLTAIAYRADGTASTSTIISIEVLARPESTPE